MALQYGRFAVPLTSFAQRTEAATRLGGLADFLAVAAEQQVERAGGSGIVHLECGSRGGSPVRRRIALRLLDEAEAGQDAEAVRVGSDPRVAACKEEYAVGVRFAD